MTSLKAYLTKRPFSYTLAKAFISLEPSNLLRATKMRTKLLLDLVRRAVRREGPVIWTNLWVPTEILYALDSIPFALDVAGALLAGIGFGSEALNVAEGEGYSRDSCSFYRSALGASLEELLPKPDLVLCTSHLCDSGIKAGFHASERYKVNYFLLDVPYEESEEAVEYVVEQLKELAQLLSSLLYRSLNKEKLKESLLLSNQVREYMLKVNELRMSIPAPLKGREAIDYFYMLGMTLGSQEAVGVYQKLYKELEKRVREKYAAIGEERFRILWLQLRPYFPNSLLDYLENKLQAVIAFEEVNQVFWEEIDLKEPFGGLAKKLLSNPLHGPLKKRVANILKLVERYRIDGVIHFSHWGCRQATGGLKVIRDSLRERGIPFLNLDGDCVDGRNYAEGQLRTRLEGFLEMLR